MRKIWASEDNCIKPWEHHFARRFSSWCEIWPFRTMKNHLAKFRKVAFHLAKFGPFIFPLCENAFEILCFSTHAPPTSQTFLALIFSHVNSFCNLAFSRHKALSCNYAIDRGAQHLQKDWRIDPLYINLEIYKALFFSLLLFFPISIFLVAKQPLRAFP